jgi:fumarate reductase flavoprotein subunit
MMVRSEKKSWFAFALYVLVAGLIVATAASCASSPKGGSAKYKAGTYKASAQGIHGDIEVAVKFSSTAILEVKILKNAETAGLGDVALTTLAEQIVKGQTLAVDTVSGASVSSEALLAAVEECVKQAGGDLAALKTKK